jgi:hypothetical protein
MVTIFKRLVWGLGMLVSLAAQAGEGPTRLEAQVIYARQQHDLTIVQNLWHTDASYPRQKTDAYVSRASFLMLDQARLQTVMKAADKGLVLPITLADGQEYELEMVQYDCFSEDFKVFTRAGNKEQTLSWKPGLYYSGTVKGKPGSIAVFSFFNNQVMGTFSIPGEGNFVLEPNGLQKDGNIGQYVLYNDADLTHPPAFACGSESLTALRRNLYKTSGAAANTTNTCKNLELFLVADYDFYLNQNFDASQLTNFVSSFFHIATTVYRNEGIELSLKALQINTTKDEYQDVGPSSLDFLNRFGSVTQDNLHGADVAVLMSTRYGTLGGIAFVDELCSAYRVDGKYHAGPYAFCNVKNDATKPFPQYSWNAMVLTHEVGHNIGSPHTHSCLWPGGPIDKCYTIEDGPCDTTNVPLPTNGGTVMSYCHLRPGIGINLANGFGPLPGNLIRERINSASCVTPFYASNLLSMPGSTVVANRECTDDQGITYYWNDNNNTDRSDDILVLQMNKKGNDIGLVTDSLFAISAHTTPAYATGGGNIVFFPAGTVFGNDSVTAFNRYWKASGTKIPSTPVEVIFPYSKRDMQDMESGAPVRYLVSKDLRVYNVKAGVDPAPGLLPWTNATDIQLYGFNNSVSETSWAYSDRDSLMLAHYLTRELGGGTAVIATRSARSLEVLKGIIVYPNPTVNQWSVWVPRGTNVLLKAALYAIDGRLMWSGSLANGTLNPIDAGGLANGGYLLHISGEGQDEVVTLMKQ